MTTTEIKKEIYKQKPLAIFKRIRIGVAYYNATITKSGGSELEVSFEIPVSDMGDADFELTMDAKLLLRWLV